MTKNKDGGAAPKRRRARGDGGVSWDEKRQRWIAEVTVGYRPDGKRIVRKASGTSKTAAVKKLRDRLNKEGASIAAPAGSYTVPDAVRDWLKGGLNGRSATTVEKNRIMAEEHIYPYFKARQLRDLTPDEVDEFLAKAAESLATSSLRVLRSILRRATNRAQKRGRVNRNVVLLCDELPEGRAGRPSKSLTLAQARAFLAAARHSWLYAYFVLSVLTGARPEELRALLWTHVDLIGSPDADPPVPPHIMVWRSVRAKGDTKTPKSRRSLALPGLAVAALAWHGELQNLWRAERDLPWSETDLVFVNTTGNALDAANVRRELRRVLAEAARVEPGLNLHPDEWTTREARQTFVSVLSDDGMPIEEISQLVGHRGTTVTETVYRRQIRPVIQHGTGRMNKLFPEV